jgi:hypothetical protein
LQAKCLSLRFPVQFRSFFTFVRVLTDTPLSGF